MKAAFPHLFLVQQLRRLWLLSLSLLLPFASMAQQEGPGWNFLFNPAHYEYSMTVTATLYFEAGGLSTRPADMVAAFVGDQIRGVANLTYVASSDSYVAYLLVKSNNPEGERLSFRMYDSRNSRQVAALNTEIFRSNAILGNTARPYLISDNSDPLDIVLSSQEMPENRPAGTIVGTFSTQDILGTSHTYRLVSGTGATHNQLFSIVGNELRTTSVLFFTGQPLSIRVESVNNLNKSRQQVFLISINSVELAPGQVIITLAERTLPENQPAGTRIGELGVVGAASNRTYTYSLVAGFGSEDNSQFRLVGNRLESNAVFDFEATNRYNIRVRATDQFSAVVENHFVIQVLDVNEPPVFELATFAIPENSPVGTLVGRVRATDPEGGLVLYSIVRRPEELNINLPFRIDGATGELTVNNPALLDYEIRTELTVMVQAEDLQRNTATQVFTVRLTDVEGEESMALNGREVQENRPAGTRVGTLAVQNAQPGRTYRFALATGNGAEDNTAFRISGTELLTSEVFDFERKNSYQIRIRCTVEPAGIFFEEAFVIAITDQDEPPVFINTPYRFSLPENSPVGTVAGRVQGQDPENAVLTYGMLLLPGQTVSNAPFRIEPRTGELLVNNPALLDYERTRTFLLEVTVEDPARNRATAQVTIDLEDEIEDGTFPVNNIVTPNGDGFNDTWEIRGLDAFSGFRLSIFNAAGHLVFQTDRYQNDWKGEYEGKPLPTGVFYYVFQNSTTGQRFSGSLTLIR